MSLVYKPGQGYWVRVMTAVAAGVLVLAAAAWGYAQAGAVRLPTKSWTYTVSSGSGVASVGDTVEVLRPSDVGSELEVLGEAVVSMYGLTTDLTGSIEISDFSGPSLRDEGSDATVIRIGEAGSSTFRVQLRPNTGQDTAVFQQAYLQTGVAGAVMLLGAIAVYWFVGVGKKTGDFLIATDGEMKKVNWSTRKEIIGSTQVVIVAAFLIAGILFTIDTVFSKFFILIKVLET